MPNRVAVLPVSEATVLRACLDALRLCGVACWRANTGVAMLPGKGGKLRPVKFGERGAPDIQGVLAPTGRALMVECKRPKGGKLSDDQLAFLRRVRDSGGVAIVARDARDVLAVIERLRSDPAARIDFEEPR